METITAHGPPLDDAQALVLQRSVAAGPLVVQAVIYVENRDASRPQHPRNLGEHRAVGVVVEMAKALPEANDAVESTVPERKGSHVTAHDVMRTRAGVRERDCVDVEADHLVACRRQRPEMTSRAATKIEHARVRRRWHLSLNERDLAMCNGRIDVLKKGPEPERRIGVPGRRHR